MALRCGERAPSTTSIGDHCASVKMKEAANEAALSVCKEVHALLWHAVDEKLQRRRAFHSYRSNLFLCFRCIPSLSFRQAVEHDDDKSLGGRSVTRGDIFGTHEELSAERSSRRSGFGDKCLKSFGVGNAANVNDSISKWRGLSVDSLYDRIANGGTSGERDSGGRQATEYWLNEGQALPRLDGSRFLFSSGGMGFQPGNVKKRRGAVTPWLGRTMTCWRVRKCTVGGL
jgi:hypothetical protein